MSEKKRKKPEEKKKPDALHRIETVLKLSLAVQRDILKTDREILAAIKDLNPDEISIIPGTPRFRNKASLPDDCHNHHHQNHHPREN